MNPETRHPATIAQSVTQKTSKQSITMPAAIQTAMSGRSGNGRVVCPMIGPPFGV